ncbi:uncharacterized protein FPOAC1_013597 [Fusarium poae]|uniref:uncharacterized protein n=1 Tax=Fusarium poae TaxID=36050 RepID=UPI001D0513B6|nr:uncharacterized protein FPOAC1_013597 [Fusarium poae]KAG8664817.1 hypothetical protein FPOAC1_013597 [Fusarium poae]
MGNIWFSSPYENNVPIIKAHSMIRPGQRSRYVLQCDRYGAPRPGRGAGIRKRKSRKSGCLWKIIAEALPENGFQWTLQHFPDAEHHHHNHNPSTDAAAHPVHRRLTSPVKATIQSSSRRVGIRARDIGGISKRKWVHTTRDSRTGEESSSDEPDAALSQRDRQAVQASGRQEEPITHDNLSRLITHDYHRVLMLWRLVVFTETEEDHEKAWECLCTQFGDQRAILAYLYGTYMPVRAQWVRCFIRKYRNFGIRVTSGTEASNNNIKSYLLNGMSHLYRLVEAIQEYLGELPRMVSQKALSLITREHRKALKGIPAAANPRPDAIASCNDDCTVRFLLLSLLPISPSGARRLIMHVRPFNEYEDAPEETYLVVEQWTRRSDLLHELRPGQSGSSCTKPYRWVLPISRATVDEIPRRAVKCGMLIPCIIHELEVQLIASELSSALLAPVGIADLQLVIEAISSRSAAEPVDYGRLEFLGDSVLKFFTVTQVYSEHPFWPEGLLNHFKDRLVSNTRLARMCLETGLSKFILAKTFTGVKWRPLYRDDFLDVKPVDGASRFIGPKTLADVVEALVGASYQDGGMHKSLKCIKVFLGSKCNWHDDGVARDILFRAAPSDMQLPPTMESLEELIGYTFKKKSLLVEAMTHGSYVADGQQRSYEQLEFLGDAVLDYIIVTRMFRFDPPVSNGRLHMIKTAMANAEFLAFTNMQHGLRRPEIEFKDGEPVSTEVSLPIWKFMRHGSPEMGRVMNETQARFESLRDEINAARTNGTHYPWTLLARLHPKKFYSDLFEAILGAIWFDSGNIETCAAFLHKFGILPYLDRILREDVHVQHPKEELGKLAVDQKIVYDYTPVDGPIKEYLCTVNVGDRVVGVVSGALNKLEAMTKAAEEGVNLLNAEQRRAE